MNKTKGCLIANFATVPLNVAGFYEDLLKMIQGTVDNGFSQARFVDKLIASDKIEDILQQFEQYQAPAPKWTNADVQP
ncbi:hypothetical protein J659_3928 [Acinetobacter baumannii 1406589]|nr:hypothetical protein J643_2142 [Acinetobacter baumannii 1237893]EXS53904.1 hypothetical protein J659_3928 [Acinetobacter baumannii 1406589]